MCYDRSFGASSYTSSLALNVGLKQPHDMAVKQVYFSFDISPLILSSLKTQISKMNKNPYIKKILKIYISVCVCVSPQLCSRKKRLEEMP